jgi:hypothetical protein
VNEQNEYKKHFHYIVARNGHCIVHYTSANIMGVTYNQPYNPKKDIGFDIWDLEQGTILFSNSDAEPLQLTFDSKENLLLATLPGEICLYNLVTRALAAKIQHEGRHAYVEFNDKGDKMIIQAEDIMIWENYKPTFNQLLLRNLLDLYWRTAKPSSLINSPDQLLDTVAKIFYCMQNELNEIWKSFPKFLQETIWQSIFFVILFF